MKFQRPLIAANLLLPFLCAVPLLAADKEDAAFKGIAQLHTLTAKGKNFTAKCVYPTFTSSSALARFVNAKVGKTQRRRFSQWLIDSKKELKDDPKPMAPYEFDSGPMLSLYFMPKLISLRLDTFQYLGGAHGSASLEDHNFAMVNGRAKELTLADLFVPGTNYRKLAESKVLASLKKNPAAAWIADGSVKTVTAAQLNNFSISKNAVTWLFQEYEMGPYANGPVEAKLTFAELGPKFNKSLLVR